ncbi:hypothetical protein [Mycobacterium haemophilum]
MRAMTSKRIVTNSGLLRRNARPLLLAVGSAAMYGCWAALIHFHLGMSVALRAGAAQAALSFSATFVLALALERLFRIPSNPVYGFWLGAIGNSVLIASWLIVGHLVAGTSNIAVTVAPSMIVGLTANLVYSRALLAQTRKGRL